MLSVLLYADDVVVLSENISKFKDMLNIAIEYDRNFDVRFSKKNQVLVVNGDDSESDRTWMLNEN